MPRSFVAKLPQDDKEATFENLNYSKNTARNSLQIKQNQRKEYRKATGLLRAVVYKQQPETNP